MTEQAMTTGQFQVFQTEPRRITSGKDFGFLARSDIANLSWQIVAGGGENNLHAHTGSDEIWFVLEGEVTFYTEGDREVAKLGRWGGLLIPRNVPYWFESSGSEPLVTLRFGAVSQKDKDARVDLTPPSDTIKALLANLPNEG